MHSVHTLGGLKVSSVTTVLREPRKAGCWPVEKSTLVSAGRMLDYERQAEPGLN
jgi:hypothetical protein